MQEVRTLGMLRRIHEASNRGAEEVRVCHRAVPAPKTSDKHRVFGRRVDPDRVVERSHQPPGSRKVTKVKGRHADALRASLTNDHICTGWKARQDDVTAEWQSTRECSAGGASHFAASSGSTSASRSMTLSAIAVSSGVCDTKNSRW